MVEDIEERLFNEMSKELLSNLGYQIIKEEHTVGKQKNVELCINFSSEKFLRPKFSPNGLTFVECDSNVIKSETILNKLADNIECANKNKSYIERLGSQIQGGIILNNTLRSQMREAVLKSANTKGFFWWDIHRIFFYAMKVFSHSILENWVSESKLGFVLTEQELTEQFESDHYYTTVLIGIRYSELSSKLEVYLAYFVDALIDSIELKKNTDTLHTEHVKKILDDAYTRMEQITKDYYPGSKKNMTIEIHSISGFTHDAEFKVKLYAKHYKNWEKLDIDQITIDEHTLFKYSVIPWEAVMDYAFTKQTGRHTAKISEIPSKLLEIESNFAEEFRLGIKNGDIKEPFTDEAFIVKENFSVCNVKTIFHADVQNIPIKQRLLIFSKTSVKTAKKEVVKEIIKNLKDDPNYNYTWIGVMSGAGFTAEEMEFVKSWDEHGIGLGFIDAVTKRLFVNLKTEEGKKINSMFLTECIS